MPILKSAGANNTEEPARCQDVFQIKQFFPASYLSGPSTLAEIPDRRGAFSQTATDLKRLSAGKDSQSLCGCQASLALCNASPTTCAGQSSHPPTLRYSCRPMPFNLLYLSGLWAWLRMGPSTSQAIPAKRGYSNLYRIRKQCDPARSVAPLNSIVRSTTRVLTYPTILVVPIERGMINVSRMPSVDNR